MNIDTNNSFKQVYAPILLKSRELFKANGDVEYLPYAAVPVRCYLISEHTYYLKNGKTDISYTLVPMWNQNNMDGVVLEFDENGYCINETEEVAKFYNKYNDCMQKCEFVLNPTIMDLRLHDWEGREVRTLFNYIENQQKEAFSLAKEKNDEILSIINKEKE